MTKRRLLHVVLVVVFAVGAVAAGADERLLIRCATPESEEVIASLGNRPGQIWRTATSFRFVGFEGFQCHWKYRAFNSRGKPANREFDFRAVPLHEATLNAQVINSELEAIRAELAQKIVDVEAKLIDRLNSLSPGNSMVDEEASR